MNYRAWGIWDPKPQVTNPGYNLQVFDCQVPPQSCDSQKMRAEGIACLDTSLLCWIPSQISLLFVGFLDFTYCSWGTVQQGGASRVQVNLKPQTILYFRAALILPSPRPRSLNQTSEELFPCCQDCRAGATCETVSWWSRGLGFQV